MLRVAYAKSTHGPASGSSQSNNLAAAAIEAASFAQQVCCSNTADVFLFLLWLIKTHVAVTFCRLKFRVILHIIKLLYYSGA